VHRHQYQLRESFHRLLVRELLTKVGLDVTQLGSRDESISVNETLKASRISSSESVSFILRHHSRTQSWCHCHQHQSVSEGGGRSVRQ
jgi:hypothetical protein